MSVVEITLPHNFDLREYQRPAWEAFKTYRYIGIVWARRHGKDLTCWNYAIKRASREPMDVTYVYPNSKMAKKNLWKAKTNDGISFTDFIPKELRMRRTANDDGLNDTDMSVQLVNKSIIRMAGSTDADSLRGANSKLYVLSEFPLMDPQVIDVIEPIVEANGGQILVNFTPKGDNHARGAWESWKDDKDWFTQTITAHDTNVFSKPQLENIRRRAIDRFRMDGRSEVEAISYFEQEYLCSFDTPVIGSYYGEQMKRAEEDKRIGRVPYDTGLQVDTWWDLGMDDSTTIWFAQTHGKEIRLIDYYESSGEGLSHYAQVLQQKGYVYRNHYAPHDIQVRELGSGKSRIEQAKALGIHFKVSPRLPLEDGIAQTRAFLSRCWFDEEKCKRGIQALKNYHKEYDEELKVYRSKPLHDWSSHSADSFRTGATGFKEDTHDMYVPMDDIPSFAREQVPPTMTIDRLRNGF